MSFSTSSQRIFTSLCVGHREFSLGYALSNFYPLGAKKNMIAIHWGRFILGSTILAFLHQIGFYQITVFVQLMIIQLLKSSIDLTQSKVQIHYANTEVNTQEIRLDPLLLMNFYTNEDLSKHCLKDWNVSYGTVVKNINVCQSQDRLMIQFVIIIHYYNTSSTSREENTKHQIFYKSELMFLSKVSAYCIAHILILMDHLSWVIAFHWPPLTNTILQLKTKVYLFLLF